jgi:hypothetical protein
VLEGLRRLRHTAGHWARGWVKELGKGIEQYPFNRLHPMNHISSLCSINAALDRQLALNDLLLLCLKNQFLRLRMLTKELQILENYSPYPFKACEWEIESEFGILPFNCPPFSHVAIDEWKMEHPKKVTPKEHRCKGAK